MLTTQNDTAPCAMIFLEDPGAYHFLRDFPATLTNTGWQVRLVADGFAQSALRDDGSTFSSADAAVAAIHAGPAPDLVIAGTSENSETRAFDLFAAARQAGVHTLGVVDGTQYPEYRFRGTTSDPLAHAPDWIAVPDTITRKRFISLGMPAERVVACGHPGIDLARAHADSRQRTPPGEPGSGRPRLVFIGEPAERFSGGTPLNDDVGVFRDKEGTADRMTGVMAALLDTVGNIPDRPYLVLRLHPKSSAEDFEPHGSRFDEISTGGDPYDVIAQADLVVGMSSSLLLAAAAMGKPNISMLVVRNQEEMLPTIGAGLTPLATDTDTLHGFLDAFMAGRLKAPAPAILDELLPPDATNSLLALTKQIMVMMDHLTA